jgi:hypothetical protein
VAVAIVLMEFGPGPEIRKISVTVES